MKKSIFKRMLTAVLAVGMLICGAGCGGNSSNTDSSADQSLQKVKDNGKFVLGLDATFKGLYQREGRDRRL